MRPSKWQAKQSHGELLKALKPSDGLVSRPHSLTRIEPNNKERFYLMMTLPNLFGEWVLLREWGRIGSPGRVRLDVHPSEGDAINALTALAQQKRRRGYALQQGF